METPGLLSFYKDHKKKEGCLGTIPLSNAVVTVSKSDESRFVIDTEYGVFYLRTRSANRLQQRDDWISTIRLSQDLFEDHIASLALARGPGGLASYGVQQQGEEDEEHVGSVAPGIVPLQTVITAAANIPELRAQLAQLEERKAAFAALVRDHQRGEASASGSGF